MPLGVRPGALLVLLEWGFLAGVVLAGTLQVCFDQCFAGVGRLLDSVGDTVGDTVDCSCWGHC
jgi:hypothetical protein